MTYYTAIYTEKPLEEILERCAQPKFWRFGANRGNVGIVEGDIGKDPNGADELRLTEHFYTSGYGTYSDDVLCLADEYLRILGGKIYIMDLLCEGCEELDVIDLEGLEGFEGVVEIWKSYFRMSDKIETIDLKDISERLHDRTICGTMVRLNPYTIYEVVNSAYRHE